MAQFEGWATETNLALTQDEREFLDASVAERQAREAEEAARRRRELETAQTLAEAQRQRAETEKRRAEDQAQAAHKLRQRAVYLSGALLVAVTLAFAAVWLAKRARTERNNAEYQRQVAFARELSVNAVNNLSANPERSILLAMNAVSVSSAGGKPVLLEAEEALHRAVQASRLQLTLRGYTAGIGHIAYSPDGRRLVTSSTDGTAKVWDAATGEVLLTLSGHIGNIYGVAFSPDGTRVTTAGNDRTVKLWDVSMGNTRSEQPLTLYNPDSFFTGVVFSPDGKRLATSSPSGLVRIYAVALDDLVVMAKSRVTRALTTDECRKYLHLDKCP